MCLGIIIQSHCQPRNEGTWTLQLFGATLVRSNQAVSRLPIPTNI
jgi:hypothetical protein